MFDAKTKVKIDSILVHQDIDARYYHVNSELYPDQYDDYDIIMNTCFILPTDNLSIIINIDEVNRNGEVKLNLLGVTNIIDDDNYHVRLSEISTFDDHIVYMKNIMKLTVVESVTDFNYWKQISTAEGIHQVCTSILHYFFCNRYHMGREYAYTCGDMGLNLC